MNSEPTSPTANVRHSSFLSFWAAVALGSAVSVGLGVYLLNGPIFRLVGRQTPGAYLLALLFFVPIVLTLAERAAVYPGSGGLFNLAKRSQNIFISFTAGWLLLGGTLFLGAILAWGAGQYLQVGLANYFDLDLNPTAIGLTLVLLVTLSQLYGSTADWRNRTIFIFGAILLLPLLLVWAFLFPPVEAAGYAYLLTGDNLQAVPYLAISLWGISFVLDRRDQMQRPERRILWVLLLVVGITAVLGAWLAVMLLQYPLLIAGNLTPLLALAAALNPNFELLLMLGSLGLALFGLGQVVVRLVHLAGLMTANGFLPPEFQRTVSAHQYPVYALLFLVSLLGIILLLVSPALIVTAASGTLMLALALVHLPGLLSTKSPLPPDRGWKLPLHPLFSALSVALTLTMLFLPPVTNQILLTIWLAVGIGFYFLYARQSSIAVRQQEEGVGEWELTADSTQEHMMVAVQDVAQSAELVATAVKLAQAREAQLFVLQVMVMPEQAPHPQQREAAEAAWQRLANRLQQLETGDVLIHPLVRLAPDVKAGILTTIWEENIKTLIVGWPDGHEDRLTVPDDVVTEVVPRANCEVIIPRGALPPSLNRVLVPLMSEGHAPAALAWGQALARQDEGTVVALGLMREALTPERSAAAYGRVQEIIAKLDDKRGVEPLIEQAKNPKAQIIATAQNYELTLLGVSDEGFLAQTRFGGMPTEIALTSNQPVFLVKSREATSRFWLRRTWERLFELLPTLTASEQAAVYLNMRHSGKASIDFYVLMILAAAIAYFGLLQDSDAVVIGAMLVAPLMNPILALSQGIVQGNIRLMRTAAATTFNGAITAVALTTFVTMFFLSLGNNAAATDAILSRTSPGMLDLLVALVSGAAAAYATSRSNVAGALPGVAIAAALVPPLAVVGYGLGLTQFEIATGALLLFLTNLAAIILAGAVTFLLLGFRPPLRMERDDQTKFGLRVALVGLLLISIPLVLASVTSRIQTGNTAEINHTLSSYWLPNEALVTDILIERNRRTLTVSFTVLDFTGQIGTADIAALQEELSTAVERSVVVQAVITRSELEVVDENFDPLVLTPTVSPTLTVSPTIIPTLTPQPILPIIATLTATAVLPLPIPPLLTLTPGPTMTATAVITPSATPALTPTIPTATLTATAELPTPTPTITATAVITPTATPIITPTLPLPTATISVTMTATAVLSVTLTPTP